MKRNEKIAYCAMLTALAMIFSYVESMIPLNFGIPGVKLGAANLVTVMGLYFLSPPEVLVIVAMRIVLTGFLFGNGMSIIYSLAGGLLSILVMIMLKRIRGFSMIGVSIAGGIAHNIGQLAVAACVVENLKLIYYLPVLLAAGMLTGMLIGVLGKQILAVVRRGYLRTAGELQ